MFFRFMGKITCALLLGFAALRPASAAESWTRAQKTGELRWGADATGGAPYIFPDVADPTTLIGFEVEIMNALGRVMKVKPVLVLTPWEELVPALLRDNFDMAFNGLEITPERRRSIAFTRPYYYFSEQLTIRREDTQWRRLTDL